MDGNVVTQSKLDEQDLAWLREK